MIKEAAKGLKCKTFVSVYEGCKHGFAVRGDEKVEAVATARQKAFDETSGFFLEVLK